MDTLKSPRFLRGFYFVLIILAFLLWIASTIFGWVNSVVFISHISVAAIVLECFSAWSSARTEVKMDDNNGD